VTTRGIKVLEEHGAAFEVVEYLYKQKGAGRAADAVGWSEDQVIKSLVVAAGRDFWFVLVPAHRDLSLKKLARLLGVKSVEMATVRDAERLTGYVEGGISPFGSYAALPVVMEERMLEHDRVLINAGHRGVLVAMSPWDLQELLSARVEDVVA
jgi:Cys-tRNA(Pro)/Cys-tRNA(Cys) deacylase